MTEQPLPATAEFQVQMGEERPQIVVTVRDKRIPLDIEPLQAAELGRALLAASALCDPGQPKPEAGSALTESRLPIRNWYTIRLDGSDQAAFRVELLGGASLLMTLASGQAVEFGSALHHLARMIDAEKPVAEQGWQVFEPSKT